MKPILLALPLFAILAGCAAEETATDALPADVDAEALNRIPDDAPPVIVGERGPYEVTIREDADLPDFTIYEPEPTAGGVDEFAVIAWGNGGCANNNASSRAFLETVASHGFLVVAPGPLDAPEDNGWTTHLVQQQAMDWAEEENARSDGALSGRIDTENMALAGWSCGGLQSLSNLRDPRVKSIALFNSGLFDDELTFMEERAPAKKADLQDLHSPIAYFSGGPVDPAHANAADDYPRITHVPVFFGAVQTGHQGTFAHPGGGRVATAAAQWFAYTLYGDEAAGEWFVGEDCGLCTDEYWTVQRRNI